MEYPQTSQVVQGFSQTHQDLFEIRRILGSLSEMPEGILRTELHSRISSYLSSGETIDSLKREISRLNREIDDSISNCEALEERCYALEDTSQPVLKPQFVTWSMKTLVFIFLLGCLCGYLISTHL